MTAICLFNNSFLFVHALQFFPVWLEEERKKNKLRKTQASTILSLTYRIGISGCRPILISLSHRF
jgi:hypothetical protein